MNDQTNDGRHVSISRRTILKTAGGVALIGTVPSVGAADHVEWPHLSATSPACGELLVSATGSGSIDLHIYGPDHVPPQQYRLEVFMTGFTEESGSLEYTDLDAGDYIVDWEADQGDTEVGFEPFIVSVEACSDEPDPETRGDCKTGGYERYGFKNQGQCIRFVNSGKDSRTN
jgi:hypothetical protein